MPEPNYGTDLALTDAFERTFPVVSGRSNLVRAIFRRLSTGATGEAGQEIYEGQCLDVRDLFVARLDASRLPSIERQVERVCAFDERIDSATCKARFNFSRKSLELSVNLIPADGSTPFVFVITSTAVTVELLNGDA